MNKIPGLIIEDIVSGVLPFGARLTIDELSTRYGVSHMPIREALRELSGSGLLEVGSGRTARVREMNRSYIEQLFATRNALEVMLARRAAQRATPALLRPATEAQERLEACAAKDEASGVLVANREFHMAINAIADNAEGVQLVDQRWILMRALWARVGYGAERYPGVISDHRHLLTALSEGDAEAAAAIMGAHVIKAKYELLSRLAESRLLRVA